MDNDGDRLPRFRNRGPESLSTVVTERLRDPATAWSLGTFGAIAEFMYDVGEPREIDRTADLVQASTDRGAIRLRVDDDIVPVAYETPSKAPGFSVWRCTPPRGRVGLRAACLHV